VGIITIPLEQKVYQHNTLCEYCTDI